MSRFIYLIWMLVVALSSSGQSVIDASLAERFASQITAKAQLFEERLDKRTEKMLTRLERQECNLRTRLMKQDTVAARLLFDNAIDSIQHLRVMWSTRATPLSKVHYDSYLDSLHSSLQFLLGMNAKVPGALAQVEQVESRLQQVEQLKIYLRAHKEQLKTQLSKYTGFTRGWQRMNKTTSYYSTQIATYKAILKERKKATDKVLTLLKQLPAYRNFVNKNTQLASILGTTSSNIIPGLQTRAQVQQLISERLSATGGSIAIDDQLDGARSQLDQLQQRLPVWNSNNSDIEMPDFKPDAMRGRSLLQRLEMGYNVQFQQSSNVLPGVAALGLSLGYKINEKSVVGVGAAYLLGLGKPVKEIVFSNRGMGLRCYADVRLKGSIWISGGIEYNYNTITRWQQSGLIGMSRKVKVGNKEAKTQLLWDMLSYKQVPRTTPFKFRIGYNFK